MNRVGQIKPRQTLNHTHHLPKLGLARWQKGIERSAIDTLNDGFNSPFFTNTIFGSHHPEVDAQHVHRYKRYPETHPSSHKTWVPYRGPCNSC